MEEDKPTIRALKNADVIRETTRIVVIAKIDGLPSSPDPLQHVYRRNLLPWQHIISPFDLFARFARVFCSDGYACHGEDPHPWIAVDDPRDFAYPLIAGTHLPNRCVI
jgi:hypothetical protein